MNVLKALTWRYAVKQFSAKKLDENLVQQLLEATRLSASSYGLQPYRLLVVRSDAIRKQLLAHSLGQDKVAHCSHLLILAAQTNIGAGTVDRYIDKVSAVRGLPLTTLDGMSAHLKDALAAMNAQQRQEWAHQQAYIALGNLLTCAALLGIDACPMAGFDQEGFDRVLGLNKKHLTTTVLCPIGYRHPDDASVALKKVRFDLDELVVTF